MAKVGRPSEYDPKFCDEVDKYLSENQDKYIRYRSISINLKVKLPTIEGFSAFLNVSKTTIYSWASEHEEFLNALEKILQEQHNRLINSGLSGEYNSTIAKLILSANHGMSDRIDISTKGESLNEKAKEKAASAIKGALNDSDTQKGKS